jgi:hypothetical protein
MLMAMSNARRAPAVSAIGLLLAVAAAPSPAGALRGPAPRSQASGILEGAVDVHVHATPDDRPRSVDAIEAARQAAARGMRAIVLKNHYESSAGVVFLVRKLVPGIEVFGGIDLNLTVGGINPAAVEHMTRVSGGWGRVVWMSTFDAENQVRFSKEQRPFVSVSRNGVLLPEVKQVLALIAKHGLVLATGHVMAGESLMLLREARAMGVSRMIVTHALSDMIAMSVAQMKEAAALGAFIEFVGANVNDQTAPARLARFTETIRAVGPEHCILSSDLGQPNNPLPTDGFAAFLVAMQERGFSAAEIDRMARRNPATLLGLATR